MRIRGAGAVHEERRLHLVARIREQGGSLPRTGSCRDRLRHDAAFVEASGPDENAILRALLATRAELIELYAGSSPTLNLGDLPRLPPPIRGRDP